MALSLASDRAGELDAATAALLASRADTAIRRARAGAGEVLVSVTVAADPGTDPSAVVVASRRAGDEWFCFEQPERNGRALAALGCARKLTARGPERFERVGAAWRELVSTAVADDGLVAVGGFAFAAQGGASGEWGSFEPASLNVPEVALARRAGETLITFTAFASADDMPEDLVGQVARRAGELRARPLPLLDPAPVERARITSPMPPEHYESAVARAVELIAAGELEKIVLAREVRVHAPVAHDPPAVFAVLREAFPDCYVYCAGSGDAVFLGASPELLVRREGQRASTVALAGSARRSADPAVDAHLGEQLLRSVKDREEQAIVARRIEATLRRHSVWVTTAPEPALVRVANIQHLATPIRAQLTEPIGAVELAGLMHPTPAVGGEPWERAEPLIPALEGLDRGWYAGPVGWTDAAEDGEFCVALRCALLRGRVAHCFAGVGVVRDSDPSAELAETEIKLQALLPILAG